MTVTTPWRVALAVARKDLLLELRTRERLVVMGAFVVLVAVLAHYSMDPTAGGVRETTVGYLWLGILLAGIVGVGRTFEIEAHDGGFEGVLVSPVPLGAVFLGKWLANLAVVWLTTLLAVIAFRVLLGLEPEGGHLPLAAALALGTMAFTALATLFSAVSAQTRLGSSLLPVLIFPLLVPIVIHGVGATLRVVAGRGFSDVGSHLRILGAEALLSVALGVLLFRFTVED